MASERAFDSLATGPTVRRERRAAQAESVTQVAVSLPLDDGQLAALEEFQRIEGLPSREAALAVLMEIAFETIATPGRRFWDQPLQPVWTVRDAYRCSNGDVWSLLHEAGSGRLRVRHVANAASGGHLSEMDVDMFLLSGNGPEHVAVRAMISGLAAQASDRLPPF